MRLIREDLLAVAVESTYNWYWLVDGLGDHGYSTRLVNTTAVQQYSGLKYSGDRHDAYGLAHLMRLGILPTGYICPRQIRDARDLLSKRLALVRERARNLTSVQNILARELGHRVATAQVRRIFETEERFRPAVRTAIAANLAVIETLDTVISGIQGQVLEVIKPTPRHQQLKTISCVGDVLAPTIALETGEIDRFKVDERHAAPDTHHAQSRNIGITAWLRRLALLGFPNPCVWPAGLESASTHPFGLPGPRGGLQWAFGHKAVRDTR